MAIHVLGRNLSVLSILTDDDSPNLTSHSLTGIKICGNQPSYMSERQSENQEMDTVAESDSK